MNRSIALIMIGGIYAFGFLIFHLMFWKIFKWKEQLAKIWPANSAILQVENLCLIFIFALMAYISLFKANELLNTSLGITVLIGFSLFWFFRAIEQAIFFKLTTRLSVILTVIFILGALLYFIPAVI